MAASISAARLEWASMTAWGTPAMAVAELSRRPGVGDDGVARLDGHTGRGHPPDHGGGMDMRPPQGRVGRLPAADLIGHGHHVATSTWSWGQGSPARQVAWRVTA